MAHYAEATKMNEGMGSTRAAGLAIEPAPTDLSSLRARLGEACTVVVNLNDRHRRVGDALYGVRPEKEGAEVTASRIPSGALEEISETVDRLFGLLNESDRLVGRLSTLA